MTDLLIQLTRIAAALERIAETGQFAQLQEPPDELVRAIGNRFGDAVFTVSTIMDIIEADSYDPLTYAVERTVDLNGSPQARATRLGQALAGLAALELVGTRRNAAMYRVRQGRKAIPFD